MTIDELLAAAGLTANDEIPIWDAESSGEPTKKITAQNLAEAIKTLASLLSTSGGTMTGNLIINRTAGSHATLTIKNNTTGVSLWIYNTNGGVHGLYSDGYYNGSGFVSSGIYMISRGTDGKVTVRDHYNKSEVEARGVLYQDVTIGNITLSTGGYASISSFIPTGLTPIAAAILDFGSTGGALSVTANGQYILGNPSTTTTNVKVRFYYRG